MIDLKLENIYKKLKFDSILNLKYNLLSLIQVIFGLINYSLMIKNFGVSAESDAYYLSVTIINSLSMISSIFSEQFLYFYNDIKVKGIDESIVFYQTTITFNIIFQIFFLLFLFFQVDLVIKLFAFNINLERYSIIKDLLYVLLFSFFFSPINQINNLILNSEMKFILTYTMQIISSFITFLSMIYIYYFDTHDIKILAYSTLFSIICNVLFQTYTLNKLGFKIKLNFYYKGFSEFLKNSFTMKIGHNIHNFLVNPIISNTLSILPTGYVTSYSYADRMVSIMKNISIGPSFNIVQTKISLYVSENKYPDIKNIVYSFLKLSILLMTLSSMTIYFFIPSMIIFFSRGSIILSSINTIKYIFLLLSLWSLIVTSESPFVQVLAAKKNSRIFIIVNSIFIVSFFLLINILKDKFGIYSVPMSLILCQILNSYLYISESLRQINQFSNDKVKL